MAYEADEKRRLIEPTHPELSIVRQCELLGLSRSSWYYQPTPETQENLSLMRLIDEEYTRHPFYGSRRMVAVLERQGHEVNRKRVQRLMGVSRAVVNPQVNPHRSEIIPQLGRR